MSLGNLLPADVAAEMRRDVGDHIRQTLDKLPMSGVVEIADEVLSAKGEAPLKPAADGLCRMLGMFCLILEIHRRQGLVNGDDE